QAAITVNKNTIPFDSNPPLVASGIRIGTPALSTRGMRETEMDLVGDLMAEVLRAAVPPAAAAAEASAALKESAEPSAEFAGVAASVRRRVRELCERFPLYGPPG